MSSEIGRWKLGGVDVRTATGFDALTFVKPEKPPAHPDIHDQPQVSVNNSGSMGPGSFSIIMLIRLTMKPCIAVHGTDWPP